MSVLSSSAFERHLVKVSRFGGSRGAYVAVCLQEIGLEEPFKGMPRQVRARDGWREMAMAPKRVSATARKSKAQWLKA